MKVVLLRLAGPIQSWGMDKFERRGTERLPTKSAVIGMISAALGRKRYEAIDDLLQLKFAVRVDQDGIVMRDFQVSTLVSGSNSYITERYYLADSIFLVGLEGDDHVIEKINTALIKPFYPLYLGRRSCPPEGRVNLGLFDGALLDIMMSYDWLASDWYQDRHWRNHDQVSLRLVADASSLDDDVYTLPDYPISFDPAHRMYSSRRIKDKDYVVFDNPYSMALQRTTTHDPLPSLMEDE